MTSWPVGEKGLLYDREWMVVGETGGVVSQKQEERLCLVQPSVDLQSNTLTLSFPGGWGLLDHMTIQNTVYYAVSKKNTYYTATVSPVYQKFHGKINAPAPRSKF